MHKDLSENTDQRLSWPQYFMSIAMLVSERSTCMRRKVGAVAVKEKRILATGYNGVPSGIVHCQVKGCLRQKLNVPSGQRHEICRGLHAEQNVIIQAATYGINIARSTLFCTHFPCSVCAKMLINCNITHIYYADFYPDELASNMLQEANIKTEHLNFRTTP